MACGKRLAPGSSTSPRSFMATRSDSSLFILRRGQDTVYLLLYVDDIVLTGSSAHLLQHVIDQLRAEFAVKDMGDLHFFLGIDVKQTADEFYLSQERYAIDILERAGMSNCHPISTPIDCKGKLPADGNSIIDAKSYRSLAGALQYLTVTRPDLTFAVQQACLHMHDPKSSAPDAAEAHSPLRPRHDVASTELNVTAYSDADWAGCPDTRRSTGQDVLIF
jgi:hypothetical protein